MRANITKTGVVATIALFAILGVGCGSAARRVSSQPVSATTLVQRALMVQFQTPSYQRRISLDVSKHVIALATSSTRGAPGAPVGQAGRVQADETGPFTQDVSCVRRVGNRYDCQHHIVGHTGAYNVTTQLQADFDPSTHVVLIVVGEMEGGKTFSYGGEDGNSSAAGGNPESSLGANGANIEAEHQLRVESEQLTAKAKVDPSISGKTADYKAALAAEDKANKMTVEAQEKGEPHENTQSEEGEE